MTHDHGARETARESGEAGPPRAPHLLVCLRCGFTYAEFRARGLLGCPGCYESFGEALHADMLHVHPRLHRAAPWGRPEQSEARRAETAAALRERLADALRFERYEEAAALRRELAAQEASPTTRGGGPANIVTVEQEHRADVSGYAVDLEKFFADFAESPVPWVARVDARTTPDAETSRLLFLRVVARRNFTGFPFWVSGTPETCGALLPHAETTARKQGLRDSVVLAALDTVQRGLLRERLLLPERPVSFPATRDHKRLWLPSAAGGLRTHALLGEVEHWTLVRTVGPTFTPHAGHPSPAPPSPPPSALEALVDIARRDAEDARSPVFARDARGFLESHPAHAGHGLQFEAALHLPSLAEPAQRDTLLRVRQALGATGYELLALSLREPGAMEAGFFRLVSRGGAGVTAEDAAQAFATKVRTLLHVETGLWERRRAREPGILEDRMHRALRVLQEARRMDHVEAQRLVSEARTGVYGGAFPDSLLAALETFRVRAQPFHVAALAATEEADTRDDLALRADLARRLLSPS